MNKRILFIIAAFAVVAIQSCKEEEDPCDSNPTYDSEIASIITANCNISGLPQFRFQQWRLDHFCGNGYRFEQRTVPKQSACKQDHASKWQPHRFSAGKDPMLG